MLKRQTPTARLGRAAQQGMVLVVALVVLVIIMIAGIAMVRSVDTATLVSGNLAFQQSATYAADKGIEAALQMLTLKKKTAGALDGDDIGSGYLASMRSSDSPGPGETWQHFWDNTMAAKAQNLAPDQFQNQVSFVVNRECGFAKPPGSGGLCVASPVVTSSTGNAQEAGEVELDAASQIYYRITVRVSGPRRTESYVQSHVAL